MAGLRAEKGNETAEHIIIDRVAPRAIPKLVWNLLPESL